ncbi:MAG: hypothetical protein MJ124_02340 [Lachnospiraceae bacterium]|nr:hypothetical protein [Lachnospiraceae bacterium]
MKKILRDTCILAAIMILTVFICSIIWSGITAEILLVLLLFILAFLITGVNYLLDEYLCLSIIKSYIVKYFASTALVLIFGFIAGWFYPSNFWMAFIYVGVVMALTYFVDEYKIKKDVAYINDRINGRKQE